MASAESARCSGGRTGRERPSPRASTSGRPPRRRPAERRAEPRVWLLDDARSGQLALGVHRERDDYGALGVATTRLLRVRDGGLHGGDSACDLGLTGPRGRAPSSTPAGTGRSTTRAALGAKVASRLGRLRSRRRLDTRGRWGGRRASEPTRRHHTTTGRGRVDPGPRPVALSLGDVCPAAPGGSRQPRGASPSGPAACGASSTGSARCGPQSGGTPRRSRGA